MKCEKCGKSNITIRKIIFKNKKGFHAFWYCEDCKDYAENKRRWLTQNKEFKDYILKNQAGIIQESPKKEGCLLRLSHHMSKCEVSCKNCNLFGVLDDGLDYGTIY